MTTTLPNRLESNQPDGPGSAVPAERSPRWRRLLRGPASDPAWARPALLGLLSLTALLYLWGLAASGYANTFYAAAVQAGSKSWKAWFFGSLDAASFITVDKPPASLWIPGLLARAFGVNAWTLLGPQALAGVAAVGVLYATVRRWFGPAAGLLAGAVLALTPVATLMFRFNNPDALLVLLLVLGAYATVRALERASTGWLALAAACVGFGFLTKQLQALLVVPGFGLAYLLAAPASLRRRLAQLAVAGVALLLSAGWWVAIVQLIPAADRPYIGGSQSNSVLELTFGYNGLGRLSGNETGSVGGGRGWGQAGWTRMLGPEVGGQVAWLLPAALILLAAGLWAGRRAQRTDRARAAFALWGAWLLVTGLTFSFMRGIFHAYYTVALAPAIAALVAMGAATLWRRREQPWARLALAATAAVTGLWSFVLLRRTPDWHPWLAPLLLIAALGLAAALAALPGLRRAQAVAVLAAGLVVALSGPAAYAVDTAATPHGGAIPSAGPALAAGFGPDGPGPGGRGGLGPGGTGGFFGPGGGQALPNGVPPFGQGGFGGQRGFGGQGPGGGLGGLLNGSTPGSELVALLRAGGSGYTWVAATVGANSAAGIQLAADEPVMAIGGFNGTDPAPTLEQFQQYVRQGRIHYFSAGQGPGAGGLAGAGGLGGGRADSAAQITSWVQQHFTATTVDGTTVYDLTAGA